MEIIMLTGESGKGKTAALHLVHEILVADDAKTSCVERVGAKNQRDFTDVLTYRRKKIKIFTMGDVDDECEEEIGEVLADKSHDVLICACNDAYRDKFFKEATCRLEKTIADPDKLPVRLAANWYDANRIIEKLKEKL